MQRRHFICFAPGGGVKFQNGFTLVELMIAMTISLVVLAALVSLFVNMSRSTEEMAKTNSMIDNGRFAIQLLQDDVVHAGYWGGFVPEFDNLASAAVPGDVPTSVPNPCQPFANWDSHYRNSLIGIAVQAYETLPAGAGCLSPVAQRAGADVLVVRHLETCVPGVGSCGADVAGRLYMQVSHCAAEKRAGDTVSAGGSTITLGPNASSTNNVYVGLVIHTLGTAPGANQYRTITAYNGGSREATISSPWLVDPVGGVPYAFEYTLGTTVFPLYQMDCDGTGTAPVTLPVTAGTLADKRRFISSIYYVSDVPHPDRPTEVVPTLMRSQFDLAGGALAHQAPEALLDGIEAFRVEIGIDNVSETGVTVTAIDYDDPINWANPNNLVTPTNRGDGIPDVFVRCTDAAPCTQLQLMNAVAVKLYVLARSREPTMGYSDAKSYCLGEPNSDGSCPAANQIAASNDQYKRHVFTTSIRLTNVSGRRETP